MIAVPDLREGVKLCEEKGDFGTRELLREILSSEEEHVDWIETQLGLIDKTGSQNYLQSQMG
jgi:bacterioferritin